MRYFFRLPLIFWIAISMTQTAGATDNQMYMELRTAALNITAQELHIPGKSSPMEPYGVIMETTYPEGTATLVAFSTGDASLYLSTGGGVIGGMERPGVNTAARKLVASAKPYVSDMQPAHDHSMASVGMTRFYVLTPSGTFVIEAAESILGNQKHKLSPLFYYGQDVITQLRLTAEAPSK